MIRTARYGTRDLERAREFYDALAAILGARRVIDREELTGYQGTSGAMFVIGRPLEGEASVGNGTQMVFEAPSRMAVDAVHAKALEMGGTCEGAPGLRGAESMGFYAAYFRDRDGNKLVVVKIGPE
jgi:catechol 2,3-dioxygenase-like lactoylglutathione lyase family enzyme